MLQKTVNFFAGIPLTIVGGCFLLASLVLLIINQTLPVDPAWACVFICGIPIIYAAISKIISSPGISKISSSLLISIAMIAAIAIGDLFAAGEVACIMAIGDILETKTSERAKKGLKRLIDLAPRKGRRIRNGKEELISAEDIQVGDILRVLPGESIPVDGEIIVGNTSVDQSIMTGESLPVDKEPGDEVFCGTLNKFGAVDIKATKVGEDSSLQSLIRMVQNAENKKAPAQRIADICASWMVPLALLIAIVVFVVTNDLERSVAVLVVFCPCALVLATPTAIMAAIGQATKQGVIIKSGEALEKMGRVDIVAFDKTGTLTYGKLQVSDVIPFDSALDDQTLLQLVASAEAKSEHPLGKAIVNFSKVQNTPLLDTTEFNMESGKGISATLGDASLLCGTQKFLQANGIVIQNEVEEKLDTLKKQGKALVLVANNNLCIGLIALTDVLRSTTPSMVAALSQMNTSVVLLTGDNRAAASYFASQAGIGNVRAELLPENKVEAIESLQENGHRVCMIGDGVNDAPALKTASVGIAMGGMGSDIAVDAADIALMSDDVSKLPYLKRLSLATISTIKLSIAIAMTINFIALILSVLGIMGPTIGALVHNVGSCFVVLLAALLYDRKLDDEATAKKRKCRSQHNVEENRLNVSDETDESKQNETTAA